MIRVVTAPIFKKFSVTCLVITFLRYALAVVLSVTVSGNAVGPGSSFLEEAEVNKLGVQTGVELAVETEVDRPNVGAELVVGTGTGETEDGKSDSEAVETEVEGALTGTTEAEGMVMGAAVAIVTGPVTAAVERTEVTGGLVTTGEVTEAVVLGTGIGVIFDLHRMIGT